MRRIITLAPSTLTVLVIVIIGNITAWAFSNRPSSERAWAGMINGVSFSPYQADEDPTDNKFPTAAEVDSDLKLLQGKVKTVRTYSTESGNEFVPAAARKYGIEVTAGAWLSGDQAHDEQELNNLVRIAHDNPNVKQLIVGNETILRAENPDKERELTQTIIADIQRVKRQVNVPVSTAEPWHVWQAHPELAKEADFIALHLLPYWEKQPIDHAIPFVQEKYDLLHGLYPDKHILIDEIGWPSDGPWREGAEASLTNEAKFIRGFLNVAATQHLDYYIMEAFDQPWKRGIEGSAGAYWGLFDAERHAKFDMSGGIFEVPAWPILCAIATALALLPMGWFVLRRRDLKLSGQVFYAALIQTVVSVLVWTGMAAMNAGMTTAMEIAWGILLGAQLLLLAIMLIDGLELTEVVWAAGWRRHFEPMTAPPGPDAPKVSIHVPCYNEPPHMVIETLNALAKLDYPNFEVLLLDNNTKDPAVWEPVRDHCAVLGPRFRFFHLENWPGYKAGALNYGLDVTADDVEIIGVIDSDYIVAPNWLRSTVPYFERPAVGFVQAPQDYRDWQGDAFKTMCNWEYAGFFHIGMIQRNERNAIIQHGTMTLIRKEAFVKAGNWAEWCICEDAELGLRLFEHGYEAVYMNHSFGRGEVPDSFSGYKTQRFRWAYGAVQILKRHWRQLLPGSKTLTRGQRYHFLTGWLPWFADAAHLMFVIAGIFWSLGLMLPMLMQQLGVYLLANGPEMIAPAARFLSVFPQYFEFPPTVFLVPTLSVFFFKVLCSLWLYEARVKCSLMNKLLAAVAGMALTHTVGRAVWQGLFTSGRPFVRTPKCQDRPAFVQVFALAKEELILMTGLWATAGGILWVFKPENRTAYLWAVLLVVQSIPYAAALFTAFVNTMPGLFNRNPRSDVALGNAE